MSTDRDLNKNLEDIHHFSSLIYWNKKIIYYFTAGSLSPTNTWGHVSVSTRGLGFAFQYKNILNINSDLLELNIRLDNTTRSDSLLVVNQTLQVQDGDVNFAGHSVTSGGCGVEGSVLLKR